MADKFQALIGRSHNDLMMDMLTTFNNPKYFNAVWDGKKLDVGLNPEGVKELLRLSLDFCDELHAAMLPKAALIPFRKFSPEHIEQVKS